MADVKWIKITTDIFNDEKILLIEQLPDADTILVIWLKLLCMAGKENNYGVFLMRNRMPYTEEMLATIFHRPLNTVRLALSTFEAYGMIEIEDDVICIANWEKHQNIDGMERVRELNRERNRKYRERKRLSLEEKGHDASMTSHDGTDKIREDKIREDKIREEDKENKELPNGNSTRKATKHKHGEFQHVLLTEKEFDNLENSFGIEMTAKAIKFLDEYIEEKGYKSKSHNLAIRRWVIDAVKEQEEKQQKKNSCYNRQTKADELEDFYKMAGEWGSSQ